jgi:Mg-chelatase subunit ChlD
LRVEANQSGYVSLLRPGAAGLAQIRVEPGARYLAPSEGAITLGQQPGQEKLLLVFSREPQAELDEAARQPVVEKVAAENAVYVVDASGSPAARLSVEITLTYR